MIQAEELRSHNNGTLAVLAICPRRDGALEKEEKELVRVRSKYVHSSKYRKYK